MTALHHRSVPVSSPDVIGPLVVRTADTPEGRRQAAAHLEEEHFLGAGRTAGDALWQLVYEEGAQGEALVAVIVWCAAAFRLKDRDAWIGWDSVTRARRLKLIVQARRFLVLECARRPNLASKSLGAALRVLNSQWHAHFGYTPVLAESFSDPEMHVGTVYKVTNWTALGHTAGFGRQAHATLVRSAESDRHRADYYFAHGRAKRLWVRELCKDARTVLCARELGAEHAGALTAGAGGRCPLRVPQLHSLMAAFNEVTDPRRPQSRRYPLRAMLSLLALGLLMGAKNVKDIWHCVAALSQKQRRAIGLRARRPDKNLHVTLPGYDALNDLLGVVDPAAFARALNAWMQAAEGSLPRTLALDGKDIGGGKLGAIVTLAHHRDGTPAALIAASGAKADSELPAAQRLLADPDMNLEGALITADALHTQAQTLRTIVERGGDYLIALKDNQPTAHAEAARLLQSEPVLFKKRKAGTAASKPASCGCSPSSH